MARITLVLNAVIMVTFCACLGITAPAFSKPNMGNDLSRNAFDLLNDIEWTGPVYPGGKNHTFHGSLMEIRYQIENTPDFDPAVYNAAAESSSYNHTQVLLARGGTYIVDCVRSAKSTSGGYIFDSIISLSQLRNFHGSCSIKGPTCQRLTCYNAASIALCVTRTTPFNIECSEIVRIGEIMLGAFSDDYQGKTSKCRLLDGTKKTATFYVGDIYWSLDGKWWYINALYQPCIIQPSRTIPTSGPLDPGQSFVPPEM
ncbi:hypothetical protein TWF694_003782 [Orbilia ellipsospora]|uniref:Uncharacterized protein n=1 Tax=Orbilia ellipsospora TaxID=2528407 RepID=A0AAV9WZ99_9PEZI